MYLVYVKYYLDPRVDKTYTIHNIHYNTIKKLRHIFKKHKYPMSINALCV